MIKNDRYYAKKTPFWTAQVLRIRNAFFHYFDLFDKSSVISRVDGDDEDEDFGTKMTRRRLRSGRFGRKPRGN